MTLFTKLPFIVLSLVHLCAAVQLGKATQMTSASYKKIEVEVNSWMLASLNETMTFLTDDASG